MNREERIIQRERYEEQRKASQVLQYAIDKKKELDLIETHCEDGILLTINIALRPHISTKSIRITKEEFNQIKGILLNDKI
jgi:hypothetical protein